MYDGSSRGERPISLHLIFVVDAVIGAAFGVALLLVPEVVAAVYGIRLEAGGLFIARLFGAFVIGIAAMLWEPATSRLLPPVWP